MLARIRKAAENKDSGFTLIELLVVMIIIGILAAIAIPAFLSQKNKARSTSAKADVSTIGKEIASYFVDGTMPVAKGLTGSAGTWAVADVPTLTGDLSEGNEAAGLVTDSEDWCVTVWSAAADPTADATTPGDSSWSYSFDEGLAPGVCTP